MIASLNNIFLLFSCFHFTGSVPKNKIQSDGNGKVKKIGKNKNDEKISLSTLNGMLKERK